MHIYGIQKDGNDNPVCETAKETQMYRTDTFELWCCKRLLRVLWTARRSNQSILKEVSPEYSLDGPMLKLKLQYYGHLMWRTNSLEKTLMLGKIECRRKRGWQRVRLLDGISISMDMSLSKLWELYREACTGKPGVLQSMGSQRVGHYWVTELGHLENKVFYILQVSTISIILYLYFL